MATLRRLVLPGVVAVVGCGDLVGFGGDVPPLTAVEVELTGDLDAVRQAGADGEQLRLALAWGQQWLSEPTCTTSTDDPALLQFLLAACRNPFSFTPARAADSIAITPGVPAELAIFNLPAGDVFVGSLSARIAYASLIVFDDRDGSGVLELGRTQRPPIRDNRGYQEDEADGENPMTDIIYGASFVAMTEPDTRLAFREGGWNLGAAFYPRTGCGEPLPRFSVLGAGGFTLADAYAAAAAGQLPMQDPATCSELPPDQATISIALRPPAEVREAACAQRRTDGQIQYFQPPFGAIDFSDRAWRCQTVADTALTELVVTQRTSDPCRGITHYVLRGCDDETDLACELPAWDLGADPPAWWPCTEAAP